MTHAIKLSKRLNTVASFLPKGSFFADVGSDHAYLPSYVCLHDPKARAIAGEINKGPYNYACETVGMHNLTNVIDVRLGDGLQIINNDLITELVIAGMGGSLISSILENGKQNINSVKRIIAQPNTGASNVRRWLITNGFTITNEVILEENNHIYEIVVADKLRKSNCKNGLNERQFLFGPLLLKNKTSLFYKKWKYEYQNMQRIIKQIKQASAQNEDKLMQLKTELTWIKEVLEDEKNNF